MQEVGTQQQSYKFSRSVENLAQTQKNLQILGMTFSRKKFFLHKIEEEGKKTNSCKCKALDSQHELHDKTVNYPHEVRFNSQFAGNHARPY